MPHKQPSDGFFHRSGNLKQPPDLPAGAQALWRAIMRSTAHDQWRPGDVPLLAMFCRVAMLAHEAAKHLEDEGQVDAAGRVSAWVRISADHGKTLAALAGKLRLAPSSRIRPEANSLTRAPLVDFDANDDDFLARPVRPKTGLASFR